MEKKGDHRLVRWVGSSLSCMRTCLLNVLAIGPVPNHIALILDGNRRYARKWKLGDGMGHRAGFLSLMSLMKYCYELGVKYVTVYAFSIDNFKRRPEEVEYVMNLMLEKIRGLLEEESIVHQYGVRVYFVGNLKLLNERVREAAEKAMKATSNNKRCVLLICVAYSSTDEISHAAQQSCEEIKNGNDSINAVIKLSDIERHMYMGVAPDPEVLVRTSGETRLSNFLLWQTSNSLLQSPKALWPEFGFHHLVWAILNFQRDYPYLEILKRKKHEMMKC